MKDLQAQFGTLAKKFSTFSQFVSSHAVLVFVMIAGLAILAALLQSRSYLNPSRDETKYSEGLSQIQYKTIDQEALDRLKAIESDPDIEVNPSLVPNRNNPFAE